MKGQDGLSLFADKENSTEELAAFPLNLTQLYLLSVGMSFSREAVACKGRALHRLDAFAVPPFCSEPLPALVHGTLLSNLQQMLWQGRGFSTLSHLLWYLRADSDLFVPVSNKYLHKTNSF